MDSYPTLSTRRFRFRPFGLTDIGPLAALAGEHRIADTTIGVPYPYTMEFARTWITSHAVAWEGRRAVHWAVCKGGEDQIVGYAGLNSIDSKRSHAELRFWVGSGVARRDDAVEWAMAIVEFAWTKLDLRRLYALQLTRHPFAGRVLAAAGMQQERLVRKRAYSGAVVEEFRCWGMARRDVGPTINSKRE